MCTVCILLNKEKITKKEAMRALWEEIQFAGDEEDIIHIQKVYASLDREENTK